MIRQNISLFNDEIQNVKQRTYFNSCDDSIIVYSTENEKVGTLLTFDSNSAYFMYSNDNEMMGSDFNNPFPVDVDLISNGVKTDGFRYYSMSNEILFEKELTPGKVISGVVGGNYNWHADSAFYNAKTREILTENSLAYSTPTNTSKAVWGNWIIRSANQDDNDCGPLALANLLFTYKSTRNLDLTSGHSTPEALALTLRPYVKYNAGLITTFTGGVMPNDMLGINNYFISIGTSYRLDYCNVANGIGDNLKISPIIGYYGDHFALISGKGRSLFKKSYGSLYILRGTLLITGILILLHGTMVVAIIKPKSIG